jgi:2-polyprenyl-3-methyl-5-hydroxy-6-metoxy-1,4-benzoquinol methylase
MQLADDPESSCNIDNIETYRRGLIFDTDMKGKVVLDIGGYDGSMARLALDAGASRAICLDNHQYEHYGWEDKKLDGVEYVKGDVMDVGDDFRHPKGTWGNWDEDGIPGQDYDVIINYNVLYHIRNPWAFLDKCREIIKPDGEMLLCTLFRYHDGAWMYVYEPRECNPTDETVYFGPSLLAIERLLKATGWDAVRYGLAYDRVVYRCKPIAGFQRSHEDS